MEAMLNEAAGYLWTQSLHVAVLFVIVGLVCWGLRRGSAHVRYLLWLLIVAKCLGPSLVTVSLAILPGRAQPVAQPEAAMMPLVIDVPTEVRPVYAAPLPEVGAAEPSSGGLLARLGEVRPETWAAAAWVMGAALFAAVVLFKAMVIHRRIRQLRAPASAAVERDLDGLMKAGARRPKVWALAGTAQPFVWGVVRGSIYVPADFGRTEGTRRREILAHELAHVRRYDALVNALQTAAQAVFWFHPFVWIANRAIRAEREKCCDEAAIANLAASPKDYSSAIVDTLVREYKSTLPVPSLAIAGPLKNVEDRIKTIMRPGKRFYTRPTVLAMLTIVFLAAIIVPTTIALTEKKDAPDTMALVENFFKHNYKDITAKKTLEWGEPTVDENGSVSVRYKFEATILGKDKEIIDRIFTFDKDGQFVSAKDVNADSPAAEAPSEEVKAQIARLKSENANERAQAIMRLRYAGASGKGAAAAPYLIDMLGDATPYPEMILMSSSLASITQSCSKECTFGSEAAETLAQIGTRSDRLLELLKSENWRVRADAARALGGLKDERAARRLISFLRDDKERPEVRGNAALALGLLKALQAARPLIGALKAEEAIVRKSAASALGSIGAASAAEPLEALLKDSEPEVRMAAVGGLASLPGNDMVPALLRALGDEDRQVREVAGRALARKPDGRAFEALVGALRDDYPNTRAAAAEALGALKDVRAVEPLLKALQDENSYVRWDAATALGNLKDARAVEPLAEVAKENEHIARIRAIHALGELGGPRAIEVLSELAKDGDVVIRQNAADALAKARRSGQGAGPGAVTPWWSANEAAATSAGVRQVQIDLKLFSVASKEAFLKERLGIGINGECLVLDQRQRQKLEDPTLLPPVIRMIAAPRVLVNDNDGAKVMLKQSTGGTAEDRVPEVDAEITPHVNDKGVLLEMAISIRSQEGRTAAGEPIVSARQIATSVMVGEGKSTLVELTRGSENGRPEDEAVLAVVTPVIVEPKAEAFGPVVERIVTGDRTKDTSYLDMDTGAYPGVPSGIKGIRKMGVDVYMSGMESLHTSRTAADMVLGLLPKNAWDESAGWTDGQAKETIARSLLSGTASPGRVITVGETFAFRTREGGSGLLQLTLQPGGQEVSLRYRLLKEPGRFVPTAAVPLPGKPFCIYGTVTDASGGPVEGVEIWASCGMGTLLGTGRAVTDAQGRYVLYFGPGFRMSSREGHPFNTGFQAATIHAGKDGWYEVNLCRQGNLAMSDMADPSEHVWYKNYEAVVLPNEPYKVDFVMAPAAEIRGRLVDKDGQPIAGAQLWLDGEELYPSSSVFANIATDAEGRFAVPRVPLKKFWFGIRHENTELTTGGIAFDRAGRWDVELAYERRGRAGSLQVKSVVNEQYADGLRQQQLSAARLRDLAVAWCMYADDKGETAGSLAALEPFLKKDVFSWAVSNVAYLGKAGKPADIARPAAYPIAYDRTLLQKQGGTAVAFADAHVECCGSSRLASLGLGWAAMAGTWFFDNSEGDDEQMAVFPDGRVVVLYSNGHRDETRIVDGVIELAEYGGSKAKMSVAEDLVIQRFINRETGAERIKPWKRIDAAPRTDLLRSLDGAATDAAGAAVMIDMRFVTAPADFFDEGDLETDEGAIALPAGAKALFYRGPVDQLEHANLTMRAELLDNMETGLVAMAQDSKGCSVISSPKVIVRPAEPASIRIGEQVHYVGGFKEEATPGGGPQPITEVVEQGMKVLVTCSRAAAGKGHVLKLVVETTEVKGSERRLFGGKHVYEAPRIERLVLDTGEGISVPADETLALVCLRQPQGDTVDNQYLIVMVKPTAVTD